MVSPQHTAETAPTTDTYPAIEKMPGHWLLASMGKRVLRPGGLELTRWMLNALRILPTDDVIEFAPGLGVTAGITLTGNPHSYTAIERDRNAAAMLERCLEGRDRRCVVGSAEATGLPTACASVVYGEAMLSMQVPNAKARIIREAARLLRIGGRYGIHELCLVPSDVGQPIRDAIQNELSHDIHVGVRPLTVTEWQDTLFAAGFTKMEERLAPMHLLEPGRIVADEGFWRAMRFALNVATHPAARRRILSMRRVFRKFRKNLAAVALVCQKTE